MPVEQVAFEIPKEIAEKIATGEYSRFGGVVRDAAGHIVAHLKEIKPERVLTKVNIKPQLPDNELLDKAWKIAKDNKKNILIAGGALIVIGGTAIAVHAIKKRKAKKDALREIENSTQLNEISVLVNSYDLALKKYYEAVQLKTMDHQIISNLKMEFEKIREETKTGDLSFDVSEKALKSLAAVIQGYGAELRKANGFPDSDISDLSNYTSDQLIDLIILKLREQEEVFEIKLPNKELEKVFA